MTNPSAAQLACGSQAYMHKCEDNQFIYTYIKPHTSNRFRAAGVSLSGYMLSDCEYTTLGAAVGVLKCHFGDTLVVYIPCGSSIAKCT